MREYTPAAHMHGFLSRDGMPPSELLAAGREEVTSYGTHVITGTVVEITSHVGPTFQLTLADGQQLHGRRVLVATGLRDELPAIPGVRERWGRDLLHCPTATGTRSATSRSACWAEQLSRSSTPC